MSEELLIFELLSRIYYAPFLFYLSNIKIWSFKMWITVNEASKICKCPERTLRHYAVKGQIRTGKKGKKWLLHFGDLIKKGLLSEETANNYRIKNDIVISSEEPTTKDSKLMQNSEVTEVNLNLNLLENKNTNSENSTKNESLQEISKNSGKPQRYKRVDQIGVFSELLTVFKNNYSQFNMTTQNEFAKPVNEQIVTVLKLISMGFFENNQLHKAQHFREAKNILARIVIDFKLLNAITNADINLNAELNEKIEIQFQESIIPGLIGLINRTEKRFGSRSDITNRKNK